MLRQELAYLKGSGAQLGANGVQGSMCNVVACDAPFQCLLLAMWQVPFGAPQFKRLKFE